MDPHQVEERDAVALIAPTNTAEALALARQISDPWYRCQALANVARYASDWELVTPLAQESLDTAVQHKDFFRVVTLAAWPVCALAERNQTDLLPLWIGDLMKCSRDVNNPVSGVQALLTLWQGTFSLPSSIETDIILEELVRCCEVARSWRAGATMEKTILILASRDPARAAELAQRMPDGKYKRRTLKRLSEKAYLTPRPFFWALTWLHPAYSRSPLIPNYVAQAVA